MSVREVDGILKNIYYNLKSPQAYTSRARVYRAAKQKQPAIRRRDVDSWFRKQPTATLHKPVRYRFTRNRTVVMSVGDQYQADLCDMTNLARYNDGHKFLLTCIDLFSRLAWAKPIKSKHGKNVARALEEIFRERVCKRLQTDKGTEFLNVHVRKLLKSLNIKLWISENEDVKAALVERFNRTLKTKMYKYFTANNTKRYIDVLPDLVDGYNNSVHSTIQMAPAKVRKVDEHRIRQLLYSPKERVKKYKYKVGDLVRISKARRTFKKGYLSNWTEEIFIVSSLVSRTQPVYSLKDYNNTPIEGKFYGEELQLVDAPEEYRIEKVFTNKRRKRANGTTEYFVKWYGYDSSFNSWVSEKDLKVL